MTQFIHLAGTFTLLRPETPLGVTLERKQFASLPSLDREAGSFLDSTPPFQTTTALHHKTIPGPSASSAVKKQPGLRAAERNRPLTFLPERIAGLVVLAGVWDVHGVSYAAGRMRLNAVELEVRWRVYLRFSKTRGDMSFF
jgi:hypothetical protein